MPLALLAPQGTLLLPRTQPSLDLVIRSATVHLVVVSAISACALAVAVATAAAAGRSRDGSLVLLALGCLTVGFLMLGHGYLDGLAGEQISPAARIVAVVDVWDALTLDRAYRPAWPPDRALRHLAAGRGTHFDPHCLDAFLALMAERGHRPGPGPGDADTAALAAPPPRSGGR